MRSITLRTSTACNPTTSLELTPCPKQFSHCGVCLVGPKDLSHFPFPDQQAPAALCQDCPNAALTDFRRTSACLRFITERSATPPTFSKAALPTLLRRAGLPLTSAPAARRW